jgi:hypothetical protein
LGGAAVEGVCAKARALALVGRLEAAGELQQLGLQIAGHEVNRGAVRRDADVKRPPTHHALVVVGAVAALHRAKRRLKGIDVLDIGERQA